MRAKPKVAGVACLWTMVCLAACNEPSEDVDFGAAIIARYFLDAERQCAEISFDDVASCAGASSRSKARLSARTAEAALQTFNTNCAEGLGKSRCDELLWAAYARLQPSQVAQNR